MDPDFCDRPDYRDLVASFSAGERSARELASAFCEREEMYHGYVWYLIAADLGDDEAAEIADILREAEQVCDEDVHLAELQVALWWHHGFLVDRDDARAAAHLPAAAMPFPDLPSAPTTGDRDEVAAVLAKILTL